VTLLPWAFGRLPVVVVRCCVSRVPCQCWRAATMSDGISVDGLVEPAMLARTRVQTAPGDLSHSAVSPVSGDQPMHRLDVRIVSQVLTEWVQPVVTVLR